MFIVIVGQSMSTGFDVLALIRDSQVSSSFDFVVSSVSCPHASEICWPHHVCGLLRPHSSCQAMLTLSSPLCSPVFSSPSLPVFLLCLIYTHSLSVSFFLTHSLSCSTVPLLLITFSYNHISSSISLFSSLLFASSPRIQVGDLRLSFSPYCHSTLHLHMHLYSREVPVGV